MQLFGSAPATKKLVTAAWNILFWGTQQTAQNELFFLGTSCLWEQNLKIIGGYKAITKNKPLLSWLLLMRCAFCELLLLLSLIPSSWSGNNKFPYDWLHIGKHFRKRWQGNNNKSEDSYLRKSARMRSFSASSWSISSRVDSASCSRCCLSASDINHCLRARAVPNTKISHNVFGTDTAH